MGVWIFHPRIKEWTRANYREVREVLPIRWSFVKRVQYLQSSVRKYKHVRLVFDDELKFRKLKDSLFYTTFDWLNDNNFSEDEIQDSIFWNKRIICICIISLHLKFNKFHAKWDLTHKIWQLLFIFNEMETCFIGKKWYMENIQIVRVRIFFNEIHNENYPSQKSSRKK